MAGQSETQTVDYLADKMDKHWEPTKAAMWVHQRVGETVALMAAMWVGAQVGSTDAHLVRKMVGW